MTQLALALDPAPKTKSPDSLENGLQGDPATGFVVFPHETSSELTSHVAPSDGEESGQLNREGLTFAEWIEGTTRRNTTEEERVALRASWLAGEDPTEHHPDLFDRLMAGLEVSNRRAEEDLQHLRGLHAEILGVPLDQLDAHMAAEKAKEDRLRQEARAAAPSRAPKGKAAKGGDAIGIGRAALSDRQRELLAHVEVENNLAVYKSAERVADWDLLKRIMLALGGTWKTGGKKAPGGFRFPDDLDAAELVRLAKETGEITDPKAAGFFPTPLPLAELVIARADVKRPSRILEPSAGTGSIALTALMHHPDAEIVCVEALARNAEELRGGGFKVHEADFLSLSVADLGTFSAICANPPFSPGRLDIKHVWHMHQFLEPGGVLVAIMSSGVQFRSDKLATDFRAFVAANAGEFWSNPPGSFEPATSVNTCMVRIRRAP